MPKITASSLAEHRERTLDALLDATRALVVERGYDAVSLRDIAERAGIARTAIYNYTSDKADLLLAVVTRSTAPLRAKIAATALKSEVSAASRLVEILELFLRAFDSGARDLTLLRALHFSSIGAEREELTRELRQDITASVSRVVKDGIDAGEFRAVSVPLVVGFLEAIIEAAIERVVSDPSQVGAVIAEATAFVERALVEKDKISASY